MALTRKSKFWIVFAGLVITITTVLVIYENNMASKYDPLINAQPNSVTIYSASWCHPCKVLKTYLTAEGIAFKEYDVEESEEGYWGHRALYGRGVPVIVIGKEIFEGFPESGIPPAKMKAALEKIKKANTPPNKTL